MSNHRYCDLFNSQASSRRFAGRLHLAWSRAVAWPLFIGELLISLSENDWSDWRG